MHEIMPLKVRSLQFGSVKSGGLTKKLLINGSVKVRAKACLRGDKSKSYN